MCSSFYAAGLTLQKIYEKYNLNPDAEILSLMNEAVNVRQNSKCDIIENLVSKIQDRVIIFTEYKASQEYIRWRLEKANYRTFAFDGSLSRNRKQWARYLFQRKAAFWSARNREVKVSTSSSATM